jgi:acyl carrier protein
MLKHNLRDFGPIRQMGTVPFFLQQFSTPTTFGDYFMPTKEEVFEKIQAALVDALGVDEEDVTPEATLVGDLGAESIDFLDIVFRLEKSFNIKIPRGELFPEDILTDAKYVQDGKVTETGIAELRKRMPFANLDEFVKKPIVQDFGNLLTVADMCRFVESKVEVTN